SPPLAPLRGPPPPYLPVREPTSWGSWRAHCGETRTLGSGRAAVRLSGVGGSATSLFSVVPLVGPELVHWIWGGFSVGAATLSRFYSFHYLFPFLLAVGVLVHFFYLHSEGSSAPFGVEHREVSTFYLPLYPYFLVKDLLGLVLFGVGFGYFLFFAPNAL